MMPVWMKHGKYLGNHLDKGYEMRAKITRKWIINNLRVSKFVEHGLKLNICQQNLYN